MLHQCALKCPTCTVHGTCHDGKAGNGTCLCEFNWAGATCNVCSESYYGSQCQPLAARTHLTPSAGRDQGGTVVNVYGYNFVDGKDYKCTFGASPPVPATRLSDTRLQCTTPAVHDNNVGAASVEVHVYQDGARVSYGTRIYFVYEPLCPDTRCNNGFCFRGECNCLPGWIGEACNASVIPVQLPATLPDWLVFEAQPVTREALAVLAGTAPMFWSLSGAPSGMAIGGTSAVITWGAPVARAEPYVVSITVQNNLHAGSTNSATATMHVLVPLSYNVSLRITQVGYGGLELADVSGLPTTTVHPVKQGGYIKIVGHANPIVPNASVARVPIHLWIHRPGQAAQVRAINVFASGAFLTTWEFPGSPVGTFIVGATHPKGAA